MRRWLYLWRWRRARRARAVRMARPIAGERGDYSWFDDLVNGERSDVG